MGSFETRRSRARALFHRCCFTRCLRSSSARDSSRMRRRKDGFSQRLFYGSSHGSTILLSPFSHLRCKFLFMKIFERSNHSDSLLSSMSCERHRCGITGGYTYQRDPPIRSMASKQLPPCLVPSINRSPHCVASVRERMRERDCPAFWH